MRTTIYCTETANDSTSFYLAYGNNVYYLFSQERRKNVEQYFLGGVWLEAAMDFAKAHRDTALIRTMDKIPMYIRGIEKEYGIEIFEKTKKKNRNVKNRKRHAA